MTSDAAARGFGLSLRARLTTAFVLAFGLMLVAYALSVYLLVRDRFAADLDRRLDQEVEIAERSVARNATGQLEWRYEHDGPGAGSEPARDIEWLDVWRPDGSLVLSRREAATAAPLPLDMKPTAFGLRSLELEDDVHLRVLQRQVQLAGETLVLRAALSEDSLAQGLNVVLWVMAGGVPIALLIAAMGGYWLAGLNLAPVARMTREAQRIGAQQLDARLAIDNPNDELGQLAQAFNGLFARLEAAFEQLRRFTADASHELRTPLTALRSVGEVGLRERHDEAGYREIIGAMLEEADRLTQLTGTLLDMTRAESGRVELKPAQLDLAELARDAASMLGVLAEEKRVSVLFEFTDPILPVVADATTLRQALVNLLHNALKYSPVGASVLITGRVAGDAVEVGVEDLGPGVPPEHRERIFDRFYRADAARSRAAGGFGLGLAIAKWAVEANGGQIDLMPSKEQGATFRIQLPLALSPSHEKASSS